MTPSRQKTDGSGNPISVAVVQRSVHKNQGGLATFTALLCDVLAGSGVRTTLVTRMERKGREEMVLPERPEVSLRFCGFSRRPTPAAFFDRSFSRTLEDGCRDAGCRLIHTQDLWTPEVHLASRVARRLSLPLVMSITGTLTPWALRHKAAKKKLGWHLFQKRDLEGAAAIHVTSRREAADIRRLGLGNPIAVIPLAVPITDSGEPGERGRTGTGGPRTVLYLSRIHEKKGLIHLVRAWDRLRPDGWRVVIAGQDDFGYRSVLEREIRARGLESHFTFRGFVPRLEKDRLYREADLFVLPTYSENFGLVVPEALSRSLPVITTTGTPWEELDTRHCGWWIETGTEPLIGALRDALALSDRERAEIGSRGRRLVEEEYSPRKLGERMPALYRWLTGGSPPPPFILFD